MGILLYEMGEKPFFTLLNYYFVGRKIIFNNIYISYKYLSFNWFPNKIWEPVKNCVLKY